MPNLGNVVAELAVVVNADTTQAEQGLTSLGQKVGSVGGALQTAFTGAAIAGVAGLAAGLAGAVKSAADFEQTMSGVKAVSGATSAEMEQLSGLALQLGKDTSFSASEAAAGIEELVKGGLTIPDIMDGAAKATLDLAAAGGVSLPDAATIAANALAEFNLKGEDMAHVADLIAGAANASALDVGQFKFSLQAAGAVASTVGFSFDDLAQGIAVMGKAGITGSDAGTSLKTMMLNLQPTTKAQIAEFERLGIATTNDSQAFSALKAALIQTSAGQKAYDGLVKSNTLSTENMWKAADKLGLSVTAGSSTYERWLSVSGNLNNALFDSTGKVKSMADVAEVLKTAMADMTEQQRLASLQILFGSDAIRAGAVLAKEGAAGFNDMADAMGKVTAASVGAERLNNLNGSIEQLKGSLETLAITVGIQLLPFLKDMVDGLTGAANDAIPQAEAAAKAFAGVLQTWLPILEGAAKLLWENRDAIVAVVAAIGTFVAITRTIALVTALAEGIAAVTAAITGAGGIMGALGGLVALLGGPVTLVIAAVAAAVGLLVYAWVTDFGGIQEKTAAVVAFLATLPDTISGYWDAVVGATAALQQGVADAWAGIQQATADAWGAILQFLTDWWREILVALTGPVGLLAVLVIDNWQNISDSTELIWRAITNLLVAVWGEIQNQVIQPALAAIRTMIQTVWDAILAYLRDTILAPMQTAVTTATDAITSAWTTTVNGLSDLAHAVLDPLIAWWTGTIWTPLQTAVTTATDAVTSAWTGMVNGVSSLAHSVLDPLVSWWQSTIWGPLEQAVTTMASNATEAFSNAVNGFKSTVDSVMGGVRDLWTQMWSAIEQAARSPADALRVVTEAVQKLKDVMPEWLIPHSPTPFEVGIRGIADAVKAMQDRMTAFTTGVGGSGLDMIRAIGAMAKGIGGEEFARAAMAISASETGGGKFLVEQGGTGAQGPFQFDPGGELRNFAKDLGVSLSEAAHVAVTQPMLAAKWALEGYLGDAIRSGISKGLSGAALAIYGSRVGQRPAAGNEQKAGEWYERLFGGGNGFAAGGIAWTPQVASLAEHEPEAIIPKSWFAQGGSGSAQTMVVNVMVGGRTAEQIYVEGRDLAIRRGRLDGAGALSMGTAT